MADDLCACGKKIAEVSFAHFLACGQPPDGISEEFAADFASRVSARVDRYVPGLGDAILGGQSGTPEGADRG